MFGADLDMKIELEGRVRIDSVIKSPSFRRICYVIVLRVKIDLVTGNKGELRTLLISILMESQSSG